MIVFKNYVIITPRKTGTVSLNRIMFYQGAIVLNEHPTIAIKQDRVHLENKILYNLYDKNFEVNPHDENHSRIQVRKKRIVLLVRNPYDRIVSWYHYFVKEQRDEYFKGLDLSFDDFILHLSSEYYKTTICLAKQYERIKADNFLKIENIQQELNKIGLSASQKNIFHLNKNANYNGSNPLIFFTQKTLDYFNILCEQELLLFNYKKIHRIEN